MTTRLRCNALGRINTCPNITLLYSVVWRSLAATVRDANLRPLSSTASCNAVTRLWRISSRVTTFAYANRSMNADAHPQPISG